MPSLQNIGANIINYIVGALGAVVGLVIIFGVVLAIITDILDLDLEPYALQGARLMTGGKLIDVREVFTAERSQDLRVCEIERIDTDGDAFNEWVVFYQFDTLDGPGLRQPCPDTSPWLVTVYDNDRGEPAILFPYTLVPPDRDHLGERNVRLEQLEFVANPGANSTDPIPELLFFGFGAGVENQLTIFKFQQNTEPWESPTNETPRYQVIGAFTGSGGVSFDEDTNQVTVLDRGGFDRSQLIIKKVYELHGPPGQETYMSEVGAASLSSPTYSTIDFGPAPPANVLNTEFPEKIVLAFYQSLDETVNQNRNWTPTDFLTGQALGEYNNGNFEYFGFPEGVPVSDLAVTQLQYFPIVEKLETTQTIEGQIPRESRVEIAASAIVNRQSVTTGVLSFKVINDKGFWKISEKVAR